MPSTAIVIADHDNVLRRVPTYIPNFIKPDGSITSVAFSKKRGEDGLSVDLERLSSYEKATLGDKRFRLLRLNVGVIRHIINDDLDVEHNPIEGNDAHCLITGEINSKKQKSLVKNATEATASF